MDQGRGTDSRCEPKLAPGLPVEFNFLCENRSQNQGDAENFSVPRPDLNFQGRIGTYNFVVPGLSEPLF